MITTREAVAADVPVLHAMLLALARHDGGSKVGSPETLLHHGFGPRPLFRAILAEREGEALGMVIFYPDYSTHRGEPGLYVQDIWVEAAARGLGLGKRLLAAAQGVGRDDWGSAYVTLGVDPANAQARAVYAKLGFRARGYEFLILDGAGLKAVEAT